MLPGRLSINLQNLQQAHRAWATHSGLETYPDTLSTPEKVNTAHSPRAVKKGTERRKSLGRALMRACTGGGGEHWQSPYSSKKPKTHLLHKASSHDKDRGIDGDGQSWQPKHSVPTTTVQLKSSKLENHHVHWAPLSPVICRMLQRCQLRWPYRSCH